MQFVSPSVELLTQGEGLQGIHDMIELVGKTCYKSTPKGGETANQFVRTLIKNKHLAMLEHGTVYLDYAGDDPVKYHENPYSTFHLDENGHYAVTTNLRVLVENFWEEDLQYLCSPGPRHERRYTARFITDRGVANELVRHRVFSFAQESSRYCNYSKEKFGEQLTFIVPSWETLKPEEINPLLAFALAGAELTEESKKKLPLYFSLHHAESSYLKMLNEGFVPEQARQVLPLATKTEICMTGFAHYWKFFFALRSEGITGPPHPDMKYLADLLKEKFAEQNIVF